MNNIKKQQRVRVRRGLKRLMPKAAPSGEMLYCIDTNDLYIGTGQSIAHVAKSDNVYDGGDFGDLPSPSAKYADGGEF